MSYLGHKKALKEKTRSLIIVFFLREKRDFSLKLIKKQLQASQGKKESNIFSACQALGTVVVTEVKEKAFASTEDNCSRAGARLEPISAFCRQLMGKFLKIKSFH